MTRLDPAGPLTAAELEEAFAHLSKTTGWSFFGARLALAKGHTTTAHRALRRALHAHATGDLPHVSNDPRDGGLTPAELLAREASLDLDPARPRRRTH